MEMSGERRIAAGRKQVWAALNNPSILKQCIPGCEELQSLSPPTWWPASSCRSAQ